MPRYIDADALPLYDELFMKGENHSGVWVRYRDVENLIRNAPTIEERKKGKWIWGDGVRCSNCYYKLQTTGLPSFCPACGAEMEGDDRIRKETKDERRTN